MPRPIRITDPKLIHLITIRTEGAALWLVPSESLNNILGGVLGRYQEIFDVEIFAYSFQSNHYHMLVRAPKANLHEFCENVNREIAKRINKHLGRRGHFWSRRYSDQIVVTEEDQIEALLYTVTNPVRHGLVRFPRSWPGLGCYWQLMTDEVKEYPFRHAGRIILQSVQGKGKVLSLEPHVTYHSVRLSILPALDDLGVAERRVRLHELIELRCQEIARIRSLDGKGFAGRKAILNQKIGALPREISWSPRKSCFTTSLSVLFEFREWLKYFRNSYDYASIEFRAGNYAVPFPEYTLKPPGHRRPKEIRKPEKKRRKIIEP